jgi:hypothetical protein
MNSLALGYRVADLQGMLLNRVHAHQVGAIVNEVLTDPETRHQGALLLLLSCPQEKDRNLRDRFEVGGHRHLYY